MLGEKRSGSAFYADSSAGVWEENPAYEHETPGMEFAKTDSSELLQKESAHRLEENEKLDKERSGDKTMSGYEDFSVVPEPRAKSKLKTEPHPERQPEPEIEPVITPVKTSGKARTLRTHNLFFSAEEEKREFSSVLREIQGYLSKEYSSLVTGDGSEEVKEQIRRFAGKYIQDHRIAVEGKTTDELIDAIYSEMAEFGFLTKYIYGEGIEEIDGATRS